MVTRALLLASVGAWGRRVRPRAAEFGVRLALGRGHQIATCAPRGTLLTAGQFVGLAAAVLRLVAAQPALRWRRDLVSLGITAAVLSAVAVMASLVPARRALRTDPADVLRAD
jgi:hypothetical protein